MNEKAYTKLAEKVLSGPNETDSIRLYHPPIDMSSVWSDPVSRVIQYVFNKPGALSSEIEAACQIGPIRNFIRRKELVNILKRWGIGFKSVRYWAPNRFGEYRDQFRWYLYITDADQFCDNSINYVLTDQNIFGDCSPSCFKPHWQLNLLQSDGDLPQA